MANTTLPELSKEVAVYLTETFGSRFTARHNSQVVYPVERLSELRVDVWPSGLALERASRKGFTRVLTLNIAIQQRAAGQDVVDSLTDLCDEILSAVLCKRFGSGSLYSGDGSFVGSDIFDRFVRYEENVFQSVIEVNFQAVP